MTTLEELLAMMAEDAKKAGRPAAQPPPVPPRKTESVAKEDLDLDDGPILTDPLWPAALPRPTRRRPPPPPPGRRARGTEPLGEPINSGLIDVRAMAMAYAAEQARAAELAAENEAAAAPVEALALGEGSAVIAVPPRPEPVIEPAPAEVTEEAEEAAPTAVIAEGTRPLATVEPAAEERRRIHLALIAGRAALAAAVGGAAVFAAVTLFERAQAGDPADPVEEIIAAPAEELPVTEVVPERQPAPAAAELDQPVAPVAAVATEPAAMPAMASEPAAEPALASDVAAEAAPVAEPPLEKVIILKPTEVVEVAPPAAVEPPPELLADGCYDAACSAHEPRARKPRRREPAQVVEQTLPPRPSNSAFSSAVIAAQDQLDGCGDAFGMKGAVKLTMKVAASGKVTSVVVKEGSPRFRACVADTLRRQRLPASLVGATASFPILVR